MYELEQRQGYLRDRLRRFKRVKYNYHDASVSFLEGVFSRGDRRLGAVLLEAYKRGCRFDGWSEHFRFGWWMEAFMSCHVDPTFFANRTRDLAEEFPWDHLSAGVDKEYLRKEYLRALEGSQTADCTSGDCPGCGVCSSLDASTDTIRRRS